MGTFSARIASKFLFVLIIALGAICLFLKVTGEEVSWSSPSNSIDSNEKTPAASTTPPAPKNWITPERIRPKHDTKELIPKIFHRTWVNKTIPAEWAAHYEECKNLYKDWQTMFWTDKKSRQFISDYYSSFLPVYDSYEYPIQRADAIRYFVLYHYGGVYIDLDIGCTDTFTRDSATSLAFSLDDILKFPALIPKTEPIGYSNDFMASRPRHPFFKALIIGLQEWNHWYLLPYLTVFFSTGPMFLNFQVWWWKGSGLDSVWVLDPLLYSEGPAKLFNHLQGSTWHEWDARLVKFLYSIYLESSLPIVIILFCAMGLFWGVVTNCKLRRGDSESRRRHHLYLQKTKDHVDKLV